MKLPDLLTVIMDFAKDLVDAEGASRLLAEEETGDLIFNIVIGDKGDIIRGEKVPRGAGIAGYVAESDQAIIVNDAQSDDRFYKGIDSKSNFFTHHILCVPMRVMNHQIGVLEVINALGREGFDEWDKKLITFLADMAAIAINNRRLYYDMTSRIDEMTALYEISQAISLSAPEENILHNIIQSVAHSLQVDKGSIILYDDEKDKLILKACVGLPDSLQNEPEIDMVKSIAGFVYNNGDPLIVSDITKELSFPLREGEHSYKTRSFISIPIRYKNRITGVLSLADKRSREYFDAFDLRVLTTVASQIAEVHQNLRFQKNVQDQERLAREIDIASEIQRKILPTLPDEIFGHRLAAFNEPAKEVGGDFYEFFKIDDYKYAVVVADVSGKGIPAAIFMGTARNVIRAETRVNYQPGHLLTFSNRYIYEDSEYGMFVTLVYLLIDSHNRLITYGNCGHNDQILIRQDSGEVLHLNSQGRALGIAEDSVYEEKVVFYNKGDLLILFTDGVTEYLGAGDIDLGEQKLIELAQENRDEDPERLIGQLRLRLAERSVDEDFIDDFTILAIRF